MAAALFASAFLGGGRLAWCQALSPQAERLFSEGLDLARVGDCEHARQKFAESHAADPAPGTLINWAVCEENLGRKASALALLRRAEKDLPEKHPKRPGVVEHIQWLSERVPFLRMHRAAAWPAGATVLRDGVPLDPALLDQDQPTDPGPHLIEIRAPGREDRQYRVVLGEGRTLELAVEAGAPLASKDRAPFDDRVVGWSVGGAGLAAVGVGAVTGLLARDRWEEMKSQCDLAIRQCRPEGLAAADSGKTLGIVSTVAFVAGGLGLAFGGYWVFTHRDRPPATTQLAPVAAPGIVGIDVRGSF